MLKRIYITLAAVLAAQAFVGVCAKNILSSASAQTSTAVPFLLIAPDARASGMGDAGVANPDGIGALFWNPSALAWQTGKEVQFTHSQWLPQFNSDLFYEDVKFKWNDEETFGGTIGAAITFLNLGEFIYTTENSPTELGRFRSFEYAVALAYATKLSEDWSFGGNIGYIQSSLSTLRVGQERQNGVGRSVSFDISAMWKPDSSYIEGIANALTVGFKIGNIGPKMKYIDVAQADPIPTILRVGVGYKLYQDEYNDLMIESDVAKLLVKRPDGLPKAFITSWDSATGRSLMFSTGMEYWYDKLVALRTGYYTEGSNVGGRRYLTFGAGLRYDVYKFDFSYINTFDENHPLANTLRFTVGVGW